MARGKSLCLCALSVSVLLAQTSNETAQNLNDAPPSSTAFTEDANSTPSLTNGFLSENDTSLGEINTLQAPAELAPSTLQSASARAITIPTGVDLQTYLNNAQPGDTLILPAGAVFTGNFTLPNKIGSEWITITTFAYRGFACWHASKTISGILDAKNRVS